MPINRNMVIIEDASPYFIKFKHSGYDNIVSECLKFKSAFDKKGFTHYRLPIANAEKILPWVPKYQELDLQLSRFSLFISPPGFYYSAHKDSLQNNVGLNFAVQIENEICETHWYDNTEFDEYYIDTRGGITRDVINFKRENHIPKKTMIFKMGEAVIFNTDIYHDFDNSTSDKTRVILTLRSNNPHLWKFEDYKKILFPAFV